MSAVTFRGCTQIFWRKGFQATSLEITAESGIAKPPLYAAFGDKTAPFERVLAQPGSACEAIGQWLIGFVPYCSGERGRRGCSSVNSATDGSLDQAESLVAITQSGRSVRLDLCQEFCTFVPGHEGGIGNESSLVHLTRGRCGSEATSRAGAII